VSSQPSAILPVRAPSTESTRRRLSARQALTVQRLTDAAVVEVRVRGYDGLTVRNVARTAGVAPATAYQYFSSKDHLITEVFWRRLEMLPETRHGSRAAATTRLASTLSDLALLVADEPELASACSIAMLGSDAEVRFLCDRIGVEMHRRVSAALGDDADPAVVRAIDLMLSGALLHAGMGHLSYEELPALLTDLCQLLVGRRR